MYSQSLPLLADGLLKVDELPSPHGRGRPIKVFQLTDRGRKALDFVEKWGQAPKTVE